LKILVAGIVFSIQFVCFCNQPSQHRRAAMGSRVGLRWVIHKHSLHRRKKTESKKRKGSAWKKKKIEFYPGILA
jgi:hypothetical protein